MRCVEAPDNAPRVYPRAQMSRVVWSPAAHPRQTAHRRPAWTRPLSERYPPRQKTTHRQRRPLRRSSRPRQTPDRPARPPQPPDQPRSSFAASGWPRAAAGRLPQAHTAALRHRRRSWMPSPDRSARVWRRPRPAPLAPATLPPGADSLRLSRSRAPGLPARWRA